MSMPLTGAADWMRAVVFRTSPVTSASEPGRPAPITTIASPVETPIRTCRSSPGSPRSTLRRRHVQRAPRVPRAGIVFVCVLRAEEPDDGVSDELLHHAAVLRDRGRRTAP